MALNDLILDVEGACKTWLLTIPAVADQVGGHRIWFMKPHVLKDEDYPYLQLQRVGGGPRPGAEAPVDHALIQLDAYGPKNGKISALNVISAVANAIHDLRHADVGEQAVVLWPSQVMAVRYLPEPDDGRPRYSLTAEITATAR
jgi:hypothetical protein